MMNPFAACVLLLCSQLAAGPANQPATPAATQPVATSRTDPFLKLLRDGLDVATSERFTLIGKTINWDSLRQEAQRSPNRAATAQRLAWVEFWERLARTRDYGANCAAPNVFEHKASQLLGARHKADKRLPFRDLGVATTQACDYLLAEDLPGWAEPLRLCAAAVLVGDGQKRGMEWILSEMRLEMGPRGGFSPLWETLHAAATEKALLLWAEAARDPDSRLRAMVVGQIAAIRTDAASTVLTQMLKDPDLAVRTAAAMSLMDRDVKAAGPVLLDKVNRELDGKLASAVRLSSICLKLEQWKVAGVPWEKLEALLTDQARAEPSTHWGATQVAGHCLAAGREKVALAFLRKTMQPALAEPEKLALVGSPQGQARIPWFAATLLATSGYHDGVDVIQRYIEVGRGNWNQPYDALMTLARFCSRPGATAEDRKKAMAIAARSWERRDELFGNYVWRQLEALGEMGALVRVEDRGGKPAAVDSLAVPYDQRYGPNASYQMGWVCRARVRSVEVAAKQVGISLPAGWLDEYRKKQLSEIAAFAARGDANLKRAAEAALVELGEREEP